MIKDKKTNLDIYEAYSMLSYGTRLTIKLFLLLIVMIILMYIFRSNMLLYSIKYVYANISIITPITTLLSTTALVAYMFRNGQVMVYLKTMPSIISNMFAKNKSETEIMIKDIYASIENIRLKQEEEITRFESMALDFNRNILLIRNKFTKVKELVSTHETKIETIINSNEMLKEQQLTILQTITQNPKWKS